MSTANRTCPQCGATLAPNESFCNNCGRRYIDGNIAEQTIPSSSSSRYQNPSGSNFTPPPPYGSSPYNSMPPGNSGQNYTPPLPPNVGYAPPPASPQSDPRMYGQQPPMQAGSFASPQQPQPRKGPRTGLIIGIISLLVILILVGTGIYLFTKGKGGGSTTTSPTAIHLQIKPYTYKGHTDQVLATAWSPDGKRIASGGGAAFGGGDDSVQVWDALNGGHVFTYKAHTNGVNSISWSPDSSYIVSGSDDKTVQVWQPK